MKFNKRTYTLHGGVKQHILVPRKSFNNIVAAHDNKGFEVAVCNGSGYEILNKIFILAAKLKDNEMIYLPTIAGINEYKKRFDNFTFYYGIYLTNYCTNRISPKEIAKTRSLKVYNEKVINTSINDTEKFIDHWKVNNRLTVKKYKKDMFISTNGDGFQDLANGARRMSKYGDDIECNDYSPHCHYDWSENTSKSVGITLYYWHNQ